MPGRAIIIAILACLLLGARAESSQTQAPNAKLAEALGRLIERDQISWSRATTDVITYSANGQSMRAPPSETAALIRASSRRGGAQRIEYYRYDMGKPKLAVTVYSDKRSGRGAVRFEGKDQWRFVRNLGGYERGAQIQRGSSGWNQEEAILGTVFGRFRANQDLRDEIRAVRDGIANTMEGEGGFEGELSESFVRSAATPALFDFADLSAGHSRSLIDGIRGRYQIYFSGGEIARLEITVSMDVMVQTALPERVAGNSRNQPNRELPIAQSLSATRRIIYIIEGFEADFLVPSVVGDFIRAPGAKGLE